MSATNSTRAPSPQPLGSSLRGTRNYGKVDRKPPSLLSKCTPSEGPEPSISRPSSVHASTILNPPAHRLAPGLPGAADAASMAPAPTVSASAGAPAPRRPSILDDPAIKMRMALERAARKSETIRLGFDRPQMAVDRVLQHKEALDKYWARVREIQWAAQDVVVADVGHRLTRLSRDASRKHLAAAASSSSQYKRTELDSMQEQQWAWAECRLRGFLQCGGRIPEAPITQFMPSATGVPGSKQRLRDRGVEQLAMATAPAPLVARSREDFRAARVARQAWGMERVPTFKTLGTRKEGSAQGIRHGRVRVPTFKTSCSSPALRTAPQLQVVRDTATGSLADLQRTKEFT